MNRSRPGLRIIVLLGLLALLVAQVFGMARGYQCDCSGRVVWTIQDHCHGPVHGDCHRAGMAERNHHEGDLPENRREHQPVHGQLDSRLVKASVEAPALVPMLTEFLGVEPLWMAPVAAPRSSARMCVETGPPPGVAVARTTVLLI